MKTIPKEEIAASVFAHYGYQTEHVPEANKERADLIARDDKHSMLVEVKTRFDSRGFVTELRRTGFAAKETRIAPDDNLVAPKLRKAESQLRSTPSESDCFNVVCYIASSDAPRIDHEVLIATLYGTVRLFDLHASRLVRCYFIGPAHFYRHPDLDAVIAVELEGEKGSVHLHPNPFSPRLERLQQTNLWLRLHQYATQPYEEEAAGNALIADCFDVAIKDTAARLSYVRRKYSLPMLEVFPMEGLRAEVLVAKPAGARHSGAKR
jgi:hypothetical protein